MRLGGPLHPIVSSLLLEVWGTPDCDEGVELLPLCPKHYFCYDLAVTYGLAIHQMRIEKRGKADTAPN